MRAERYWDTTGTCPDEFHWINPGADMYLVGDENSFRRQYIGSPIKTNTFSTILRNVHFVKGENYWMGLLPCEYILEYMQ